MKTETMMLQHQDVLARQHAGRDHKRLRTQTILAELLRHSTMESTGLTLTLTWEVR